MAEINVNEAYDLSLFDTRRAQPQPDLPEKKPAEKLRQVKEEPQTATQRRENLKHRRRLLAKVVMVCVLLASMCGALIHSRIEILEINAAYATKTKELNEAKSEYVRLTMAVNAKVSLDKVEAYALLVGMQKMERRQMFFINTNGEDAVSYYSNRAISKSGDENP